MNTLKIFFYKLLPYKSLLNIDENSLTAWWVIGTIIIFLLFLFALFIISRTIVNSIRENVGLFSIETISNDIILKLIWSDYSASFIGVREEDNLRKTFEEAQSYFNDKSILSEYKIWSLINSIPSILVGVGILGTFVGLTYGLSSFNIESIESIRKSIDNLLSGMGTAFVSSIWGMGLSLIFIIVEKWKLRSLHYSISQLCVLLDKKFKMTKADSIIFEFEIQRRLIKDFFVYQNEKGEDILPKNIFRDLVFEAQRQSQALMAFSADLAERIKITTEAVISGLFNNLLVPKIEELKYEIQCLRHERENTSMEFISNVVTNLKDSLEGVIKTFKDSVSDSTKQELESLSQMVSAAGNSLIEFPTLLNNMTSKLGEDFRNLQDIVQNISNNTDLQAKNSIETMKKEVELTVNEFKKSIEGLQHNQNNLFTQQSNTSQFIQTLLDNFRVSIEKGTVLNNAIDDSISKISEAFKTFNLHAIQLNNNSAILKASAETLQVSTNNFKQQSERFLENNRKTIEEIQKLLIQSQSYTDKFKIIENGIKSIFDQIDKGLKSYGETTRTEINKYLSQFADSLKIAGSSLAGNIESLSDLTENLTEQIEQLNNKK